MTTTTRKTSLSTDALIRWSGLAAVAAGAIFAGIQPIHPPDLLASVTTTPWAIVIGLKFAMCLLFLVGITGIYIKQASKAGWLGFAGFTLLILSWWLQTGFVFVEAFVLPVLPDAAPGFISSFLGMVNPASPVVGGHRHDWPRSMLSSASSTCSAAWSSALPPSAPASCRACPRSSLPSLPCSHPSRRSCRTRSSASQPFPSGSRSPGSATRCGPSGATRAVRRSHRRTVAAE